MLLELEKVRAVFMTSGKWATFQMFILHWLLLMLERESVFLSLLLTVVDGLLARRLYDMWESLLSRHGTLYTGSVA